MYLNCASSNNMIKLIEAISKDNDNRDFEFIFQHGPSFNSGIASHNCRITDDGRGNVFNPLKNNIYEKFNVFTQSSSFTSESKSEKFYVSRFSGIKAVENDGVWSIEGTDYNKKGIDESNELAEIISQDIYLKIKLIDFLQRVPKKNRMTSFLHDVKVLFASQNFKYLKDNNIVIQTDVYYDINDSNEGNYYSYETNKPSTTYLGNSYIVNPYKVKEYSKEFNIWLKKCIYGEIELEIDGISTDPGPGYFDMNESKVIQTQHQDADDWFVLYLLSKFSKKKVKVGVSDEICITDYSKLYEDSISYKNSIIIPISMIFMGILMKYYSIGTVILTFYIVGLMICAYYISYIFKHKKEKRDGLGFIGIRETFIREEFGDRFDIILSTVSHVSGFDYESLTDFYKDKIVLSKNGPIIDQDNISHFKNFFGIFDGIGDNGFGILKDYKDRKNGFRKDQVYMNYCNLKKKDFEFVCTAFHKDPIYLEKFVKNCLNLVRFIIVRNKSGRGGTLNAKIGENGSELLVDGSSEFITENGAMSHWHEFIIIDNPSVYLCNAIFFGTGEGFYSQLGAVVILLKMKEIANKWAIRRNIKNSFFGFHVHPDNSIASLHLHLISKDDIYYNDENDEDKLLPGYVKHFSKTKNIDDLIIEIVSNIKTF